MAKAGGSSRIKAEMKGLDELRDKLLARAESVRSVAQRAAEAGAGVIQKAADVGAPSPGSVKTRTTVLGRRGQVRVDIGSDKKHWHHMFFELGADPHEITPRVRRTLKFEVGESEIFARAVQHPGMAAKPFLRPAIDERQEQAVAAVGDVLRGAVERG